MRDNCILTAESVTEGHPDKLCDTIADSVLDACLKHDPAARVACEAMVTAGKIIVAGEITARKLPDIPAIVCRTVRQTGCSGDYEVEVITHDQSGGIAGAGEQGIMYGYACSETPQLLPVPVVLAHRLTALLFRAGKIGAIQGLGPDGRVQVSVEYQNGRPKRIDTVTVSCQCSEKKDLEELRQEVRRFVIAPALKALPSDEWTDIQVNPSVRFTQGTGLTGRKMISDAYGSFVPHGGGALSGRDAAKSSRSGAYMARYIAKNIVAAGLAEECVVRLTYADGKTGPIAVDIDTRRTGLFSEALLKCAALSVFDLKSASMIQTLGLDRPIFARYCNYGHFTHPDAPWERLDRTSDLINICRWGKQGTNHEW